MYLGTVWYCQKHDLEVPELLGVEVEDEATGEWSFILLTYSFVWKILRSWASHFASAKHMAQMFQALSESKKLFYEPLGDLQVRNMPQAYAEELSLPVQAGLSGSIFPPRIRLPATPGHAYEQGTKVQWVGPILLASSLTI